MRFWVLVARSLELKFRVFCLGERVVRSRFFFVVFIFAVLGLFFFGRWC